MSQTSEKIDLSAWFRKKEAAQKIGCSEKLIEKLAHDGEIQQRMYKRPEGGPRVAVYHPGDVEKLASHRNPNGVHVVTDADGVERPNPYRDLVPITGDTAPFLRLLSCISASVATARLPPSQLRHVAYLSITEAIRYTVVAFRIGLFAHFFFGLPFFSFPRGVFQ